MTNFKADISNFSPSSIEGCVCLYAEKGSYANGVNMIILPPHRHIYANSLAPFVFIKTYTPPTIPPFALTKG